MNFSESLHPRVPAGGTGGGEFGADGKAKPKAPAKGGAKATARPNAGPLKSSLSFDGTRGPGYGTKNGDPHVHDLQEALTRLGLTDSDGKKLVDDGKLGPRTTEAIKAAQKKLGVKADGVVSPAFYTKLLAAKATPKAAPKAARSDFEVPILGRDMYLRTWPLDGIEIVSRAKGGDGRTVEAYAAVFGVPKEITDQHGHYIEDIHRSSFNRTLNGKGAKAMCLYNHGLDLQGKPMAMAQVPLGLPLEIKPDSRGLLTRTRYNNSEFADRVLESIKNDEITAQSFRGPIYRSDPVRVPRTRPGAALPTVTRLELGLSDYGPTPIAYYPEAQIMAVRSAVDIIEDIAGLDQAERAELIRALSPTTPLVPTDPETTTATPDDSGPGAEDPRDAHSNRLAIARARLRMDMIAKGVRNG
jgi:HK97 family phage prohead protease